MRGLRRSTQRARNQGKIAQGAAIQMNHFLLNVEMSEWRSSAEQGIRTMQRRFAARSPTLPINFCRRQNARVALSAIRETLAEEGMGDLERDLDGFDEQMF